MDFRVLDFIEKKFGYELDREVYQKIATAKDFYNNYHKPFHTIQFDNGISVMAREMFSLGMAKKISEDLANITLNTETDITVEGKKEDFILQSILEKNDFWTQINQLWEKVQYSGLGAVTIKYINGDMELDYINGENIIPLSWDEKEITEIAFCSQKTIKGKKVNYLEMHLLTDSGYAIYNFIIDEKGRAVTLPDNIQEVYLTGTFTPAFAILKRNVATSSNSGFGNNLVYSCLAEIKASDIAFNNFVCDLRDGGKMIFYNKSILAKNSRGELIAPPDTNQRMFVAMGDALADGNFIKEFNPTLRVDENARAIQQALDLLSFKAGMGTKHYQFNSGVVGTATQYIGDRQDLKQNVKKLEISIRKTLHSLTKSILEYYSIFTNSSLDLNSEIIIKFEDSIFEDDGTEKTRDLQLIMSGIMQPWEYRVKWLAEDEETAKEMTKVVDMFEGE